MRSRTASILATLVALVAAPSAVAAFTAGGFGSGSAQVETTRPLRIDPVIASATLAPGIPADVLADVTNPNDHEVRLHAIELDPTRGNAGVGVDAAHAGCAPHGVSMPRQDASGNGWTIAGGDTRRISLAGAARMSIDSPDACQGATFTLHVRAVAP